MEQVDDPIMDLEGFLEKQGARGPGKKKYKRRYFKLQPKGELHYYASPKDVAKKKGSLGCIDLNRVTAIEQVSEDKVDKRVTARKSTILDGMHFDVVTPERTYCLVASTQKDLIRWVGSLHEVVEHRAKLQAAAQIDLDTLSTEEHSPAPEVPPEAPETTPLEVKSLTGLNEPKQVEDSPSLPEEAQEEAEETAEEAAEETTPEPELPQPDPNPDLSVLFHLDDIKDFLKEVSGRTLEVESPAVELQAAMHQFQEMQIVHAREHEDAAGVRQQMESLAKLLELTRKEQEILDKLERGVVTLHAETEKHTEITKDEQSLTTRLRGMAQALQEESAAFQEIQAKLSLLEKQKGALSLVEHHDRNIRELQSELERLPKRRDELERAIQCLDLEITTINSERQAYKAQLEQLPSDQAALDSRETSLKSRLDQLEAELRECEKSKQELTARSDGLAPRRKAIEKQQGTLDMFNKILDSPTWDEMLSAFSLVANLEQQANSLMAELGDSADESSLSAVDVDKKERLRKKAEAFEAKLQADKAALAELEGSLDGDRARNEASIAKTKESIDAVRQELAAVEQERTELRLKEKSTTAKVKSLEIEAVEKADKLEKTKEEKSASEAAIEEKSAALVQEQATYRTEKDRTTSVSSQLASQRALKAESESKLAAKHQVAAEELRKLQALRKKKASLDSSLGDLIDAQTAARAERRTVLHERLQILQEVQGECSRVRDLDTSLQPALPEALAKESGTKEEEVASLEQVLELEHHLKEAQAQQSHLQEEVCRYKTRLNQVHVELDEARESSRRDSETIMELTSKLEEFQEKLRNSSVGQLEVDLSSKEQELAAVTELYRNLELETTLYDNARTIDKERIRQQNEEIKAKDQTIQQLQEQLHLARDGGTSGQSPTAANLHRELARLRAGNHAHQAQNAQLEMEIRRLQTQTTTEQVMKDKAIAHLNQQLDSMRADYQALRHQALTKGGVDEATTRELDLIAWVKEKYFYALAVGVKLELMQRGTPVNLDVADLYQEAQYTVDVKQWQDWIYQRIMEAKPKRTEERPRGRAQRGRGKGRVSSYGGERPASPYPSNW